MALYSKVAGMRQWLCLFLVLVACVAQQPQLNASTTISISFQTYDDHRVTPLSCGQNDEVWADSTSKVKFKLTDLNGGTLRDGDQILLFTEGVFGTAYFTTANGSSPIWTNGVGTITNNEKWVILQSPGGQTIIQGRVYLRNVATGKYWIAEDCGGFRLNATASSTANSCTRFEIHFT